MSERVLYFDCFSGIAGDMTLGALVDLGVDVDLLSAALEGLQLPNWSIKADIERRMGLRGVNVQVFVNGQKEGFAGSDEAVVDHGHGHTGAHADESSSHDADDHDHTHHRHYSDIVRIIERAELPEAVKERALSCFQVVAEAEAQVHGVDIGDVHFHEVGAVDSIVDIVGVAWCLWSLNIDRIESAPLPLGRGFIRCAHGRIPLPAPATLLITRGLEVVDAGLERELVTPTGAAFIKAWAHRVGPIPSMRVDAVGFGFGDAEFPDRPNALRLILGTVEDRGADCVLIETNLDDTNPEFLGALMTQLLDEGALDVWFTPIHMKKNRPAILLSALVEASEQTRIENMIFAESTAIGLRRTMVDRRCLDRDFENVPTPWGDVRMKVAYQDGVLVNASPEFDDCAQLAQTSGIPVKSIYQYAISAYLMDGEDDDESV